MGNPELSYIHQMDKQREIRPPRENLGDRGLEAEEAVIAFFQKTFPDMEIRPASAREDSGNREKGGKAVDAITYIDGRPALGLQITTTTDSAARASKYQAMMRDFPFLRLAEMRPADPSIPRALVFLEANKVAGYAKDPEFKRHPETARQILESLIKSLQFASLKTKDRNDQERISRLLKIFQNELEKIKKGQLN